MSATRPRPRARSEPVPTGTMARSATLSGNRARLHQPVDRLADGAVAAGRDHQLGAVHGELARQVAGLARAARLLDVERAELARQHLLDIRPPPAHAAAARDGIDDHAHSHLLPLPLRPRPPCAARARSHASVVHFAVSRKPCDARHVGDAIGAPRERHPASARRDTDQRLRIGWEGWPSRCRSWRARRPPASRWAIAHVPIAVSGSISVLPSSVSA